MNTQILGNSCLMRPAVFSARTADLSTGYKWITGPITTVRREHTLPKSPAVARVGFTTWKWFTESTRSSAVVLGNHPCSVRRTNNSPEKQSINLPTSCTRHPRYRVLTSACTPLSHLFLSHSSADDGSPSGWDQPHSEADPSSVRQHAAQRGWFMPSNQSSGSVCSVRKPCSCRKQCQTLPSWPWI